MEVYSKISERWSFSVLVFSLGRGFLKPQSKEIRKIDLPFPVPRVAGGNMLRLSRKTNFADGIRAVERVVRVAQYRSGLLRPTRTSRFRRRSMEHP